ncbi:hypothetical protein WJX77_008506 [Trebouxia sp. C0004]
MNRVCSASVKLTRDKSQLPWSQTLSDRQIQDDIFALMQVMYTGQDAAPLQQDTDLMSAEDIWQREFDELWLKLKKNTQDSFCTELWKWLAWCEGRGLDTGRSKAFSKIREPQRGVPPPYGEA